jgi:hypothetical protein
VCEHASPWHHLCEYIAVLVVGPACTEGRDLALLRGLPRPLNSKTVKDKFPIPVVDELRGANFFT